MQITSIGKVVRSLPNWKTISNALLVKSVQGIRPDAKAETITRIRRMVRREAEMGVVHVDGVPQAVSTKVADPVTEVTPDEIEQYIKDRAGSQAIEQKATGIVRYPHITVPESGWFAIVFYSDLHIGSIWTKLMAILDDAKTIYITPHMYVIFQGDIIDGGIPSAPPGLINEQNMTPDMQRRSAKHIVSYLAPSLLAAISGCHDWWMINVADYDFIREATQESGAAYLGGGGKYYLECDGGVTWCGVARHKPRGHSMYNDLHPCTKECMMYEQEADIVTIAHTHIVADGCQRIGGRDRYMARTAARKEFDKYASQLGSDSKRVDMNVPVLLMHGKEKKAQWVRGIEFASQVLAAFRQADEVSINNR